MRWCQTRPPSKCPDVRHMLTVQPALFLVLDQLLHEAACAFILRHAVCGVSQEFEIQRTLVPPDGPGGRLPRRCELRQVFQKRKCIHGRHGPGLQQHREPVLNVVEGLHLFRLECFATLSKHRGEDDGGGLALDVLIIPFWIAEEIVYGLGGFGILDGKHVGDLARHK